MKQIIWCKSCILPNTRPNLHFDKKSNLCNVCSSGSKEEKKIN